MFLTDEELRTLTGYVTAAGFVRWLDAHGWRYERNRGGKVIVSRSHAEVMLGGAATRPQEPNYKALGV